MAQHNNNPEPIRANEYSEKRFTLISDPDNLRIEFMSDSFFKRDFA